MLELSLLIASTTMLIGWIYEGKTNNAGVVDVLWSALMVCLPIVYAWQMDGDIVLRIASAALMSLWYLRLFVHLSARVFSEPEDGRYRYLRDYWGDKTHRNHFFFFQFQALLAWGFTLPIWWLAQIETYQMIWLVLAFILAVGAWVGVYIADKQLAEFRQNPANKGKVCQQGLWFYSRHPNYFFEWCHWFSYPVIAIGMAGGEWLWLMPVVMFASLYFITGIPYTEQQAIRSRGEAYRQYQQTTSAFIPWRKKNGHD
jgi:steroid 5-alpha reductase family enzyme